MVIEQSLEFLAQAGIAINLFAVAVIIVGFTRAAWGYALRFRKMTQESNFNVFKEGLGSALLLGLEILVLAEVIKTIVITPTFQSLIILLAIVIIRTAVSWNLTLSTRGHWPWQAPVKDRENA